MTVSWISPAPVPAHTVPAHTAAATAGDGAGRGFKRKPRRLRTARVTARSPCLTLDVVAVAQLRAALIEESRMGILSWLRSLRSSDGPEDEPNSLIKYRYEDPAFEPVEKAAAADVAAVEEDAKFFGPDSPASQDEL